MNIDKTDTLINRGQDKTADFENETKQPILKTRQNRRFWKRDKTADFEKETKPPILKWDKTADFEKETKPPIFLLLIFKFQLTKLQD